MTPEQAHAAVEAAESALTAARRTRNRLVAQEVHGGTTKYAMAKRLDVSQPSITRMIDAHERDSD